MRGKVKEDFNYVLVITMDGPVFVTGEGSGKTAVWKKNEKPYQMPKGYAEQMALGLMLHGYTAYHVSSPIELDYQPYCYEAGHFEWKEESDK